MRARSRSGPAFTLVEMIVALAIVLVLLSLLLPAIAKVRESANRLRCQSNLHNIGLALHHYHIDHGGLPPALRVDAKEPHPFLSWQGRILPYLEQDNLWTAAQKAFAQDRRFWSPPHVPIRTTTILVYLCPSNISQKVGNFGAVPAAYTHYLGVSGSWPPDNGTLYLNSDVRFPDIQDGASNTIVVGERPPSSNERFGWWYAGIGQIFDGSLDSHLSVRQFNQSFYAPTCPKGPYSFQPGDGDDLCSMFHFWSYHRQGAHFLFADGHLQFLTYQVDPLLPALATRCGGELLRAELLE